VSKAFIESTIAVAKELQLPGPIKPGLRKRINEVAVGCCILLASEEKREPDYYRQVKGPTVRKRVAKEKGGYKYVMLQPLVETDEVVRGNIIRTERYENIETLAQLLGSCCSVSPPSELIKGSGIAWSKEGVADAILKQCEHIRAAVVSLDIVNCVLQEFLGIYKTRNSYADAGERMSTELTDDRWAAYKQAKTGRRITLDKKEHFTRLAKNWEQNGLPENLK
jgi:hypothetical protein